MLDEKLFKKRLETALEIEECLGHLIKIARPTKEKMYRIYRQFRDLGYQYSLGEIERKCSEYYKLKTHFNQARLTMEIFQIKLTSETSNLLALNFRNSKLEFSQLSEISAHLLALFRRICKPEDFGMNSFLILETVKCVTSPTWNRGEIFFSFSDFFEALEHTSFRRYGNHFLDRLKLLFNSMDPIAHGEYFTRQNCTADQLDNCESNPGNNVTRGSIADQEIQLGEIERINEAEAFNENFSTHTQVILQAELLWLKQIESCIIKKSKEKLPSYPLNQESKSKELRELESQVRLFNDLHLLEAKNILIYEKYREIEIILKNTIVVNLKNVLNLYAGVDTSPIKIRGPGLDCEIRNRQHILPGDLPPSDIQFIHSQLKIGRDAEFQGEIEYQKYSSVYILTVKDLYSYIQKSKLAA